MLARRTDRYRKVSQHVELDAMLFYVDGVREIARCENCLGILNLTCQPGPYGILNEGDPINFVVRISASPPELLPKLCTALVPHA